MQSYDKSRLSVSLMLLIIVETFAFVLILTNDAFAQSLNDKTLYQIVNQIRDYPITSKIDVGVRPQDIAINRFTGTIYVANSGSDSVSVIFGNNTKLGNEIPVGDEPTDIAFNGNTNTVYVANSGSDSVSVIFGNNTKLRKDIPVGEGPGAIAINENTNTVYVANKGSDSISVIDGDNNIKLGDIHVGHLPIAIAINELKDMVYVANHLSNSVSIISGKTNTKLGDISVGIEPMDIAINILTNTVYVANSGSDSVSVIFGNNTKLGKDILVGEGKPSSIAINLLRNMVYVSNGYSYTVSVISGKNNIKLEDIPVGEGEPRGQIAATNYNTTNDMVYVANSGSNSVSVISGHNNTRFGTDISVEQGPGAIAINELTDTVYVANKGSDSISVIDGIANKVVAGVTFDIYPFYSGHIECDGLISPLSQYFYVWSGAKCIANPNKGFEFLSWEENLNDNSSQIIKVSRPASILESIKDFFYIKSEEPEAILKITKFGSFIANFKELPLPLPPEYWATLFGVVVTAFISSWLTPTIIAWRTAKKQGSKLDYYHTEVKNLYNDGNLDSNDIEKLDNLKHNITDEYTKGKINKEQYDKLGGEISVSYREIFNKEIDSLNTLHENNQVKLLDKINKDITDAYAKEKINELHYNLLKVKISKFENNNRK